MRRKKLKRTKRHVKYYGIRYNFHEPYKVLVDGNFIYSLQKLKIGDVAQSIKKVLGTERCRVFAPYCVLGEIRKLKGQFQKRLKKANRKKTESEKVEGKDKVGVKRKREDQDSELDEDESDDEETHEQEKVVKEKEKAEEQQQEEEDDEDEDEDFLREEIKVYNRCLDEIKKLPMHKCGHSKINTSPDICICEQLGSDNSSLWWVATQDDALQQKIQQMKGVPLLTCTVNGVRLEPPSKVCQAESNNKISKEMNVADWEKQTDTLKGQLFRSRGSSQGWRRKRAKGPNPLSVKKKQVKEVTQLQKNENVADDDQPKRKRPRRKKREQGQNGLEIVAN
eukprot:TRINITY_DN4117_c0_g2_i1.p1 TRINITY_DN4117_c0_g2~~TRINITY_DN4117_c0_g2_i1.p1  ORF type:complete len:337 (+),score=50.10 TRINITY_DN4117_c0_g2_i1:65-1075(+)